MSRRTKILLYVAFGLASLGLSALLTFPYDVLGRYLETELARQQPGAALTINRIGPALPLGLYMGDILYEAPPGDNDESPRLQVDSVRIYPAWLKLLSLKPGVSFAVKVFDGTVAGQLWRAGPTQHVDVAATRLQLEGGGQLEKVLGVQLQGAVSGRLTAAIGAPAVKGGAPVVTEGSFKASVDGAHVKGGKVAGFSLPPLDLGDPEVDIEVAKGEAKIEKFRTKSSDIEMSGTGSISLRPNVFQSLIRGSLKVKLADDWLVRNPLIKTAMSMAGPYRKPDVSLEVPLTGTLARPVNLPGFSHF